MYALHLDWYEVRELEGHINKVGEVAEEVEKVGYNMLDG